MPTSAAMIFTDQKVEPSIQPDLSVTMPVKLLASTNYSQGTLLGEVTATPGTFRKYASGNVDGSQIPKAVLPYACQTDASGNITLSATAAQGGGEFSQTYPAIDVYIAGYFNSADLVGLDANAVTTTQLIQKIGGIVTGIVRLN